MMNQRSHIKKIAKLGAAAGSCPPATMLGLLPTKGRVQQDEAVRVERGVRTLLRHERPARPVGELHALVERRAKHLLTQRRQS